MKITLFAPFAAIQPHALTELSYLSKFREFDVTILRCNTIFETDCLVHLAHGLGIHSSNVERKAICGRCIAARDILKQMTDLPTKTLDNYYDREFESDIIDILSKLNRKNWKDLEIQGIQVGKLAAYEFLIQNKLNSLVIPDILFPAFTNQLANVLRTLNAANKFFDLEKPELVIMYNKLYSINSIFAAVAAQRGIEIKSLQQCGPLFDIESRLRVTSNSVQDSTLNTSTEWRSASSNELKRSEIRKVHKVLLTYLGAKSPWIYSAPVNPNMNSSKIKNVLGIPEGKIVVLVPLSSGDELFASIVAGHIGLESDPYLDQSKWIEEILRSATQNQDMYFIIRPHPREFPNKRESKLSMHAKDLIDFFERIEIPQNVVINWPDQEISIYQFVGIVDLVLNSTSSVGAEFAALGVKTLVRSHLNLEAYPPEISPSLQNFDSLGSGIRAVLLNLNTLNKMALAYRWLYFRDFSSSQRTFAVGARRWWKLIGLLIKFRLKYRKFDISLKFLTKSVFRLTRSIERLGVYFDSKVSTAGFKRLNALRRIMGLQAQEVSWIRNSNSKIIKTISSQ